MDGVGAARLADLCGDVRAGRGPAYRRLTETIRVLVGDGRLPSGTRLPAERALAAALGLSRVTVARAYGDLRDDGWAQARQGSGTWVRLPEDAGRVDGAWVPGPARTGVIDLAHAAPSAPSGMRELVRRATDRLDDRLDSHGYQPEGLPELRERVAARFAARGLPTGPEQVVVTGGALHAIGLAVAELTGPGDRVLVEHPTYPSVLDLLADVGARTVPVACEGGADPITHSAPRAARQTAARAAYVMADFQNPTGRLLDDDGRARLVHGLARQGAVAVVDETFAELDLREPGGAELPCAAHARHEDDVVTVGGASKLGWGGLRIGWIRAGRQHAARMRRRLARSQIAPPVLEQLVAVEMLDAVDDLRAERLARLRGRRDALVAALHDALPHWRFAVPSGGLALWCDLGGDRSTALASAASHHGLVLAPGPRFGTGHAFDDRLRLPFTHPEPVLAEAVRRLRRAVDGIGAASRRPPQNEPSEGVVV